MTNATRVIDFFLRNTGEIQGSLSALEPFFLISRAGAGIRLGRVCEERKGRFTIGLVAGNGCAFRTGIILPVSCCRDSEVRATLLELRETLVSEHRYYTAQSMRDKARHILGASPCKKLALDSNASLDGFIEFTADRNLFEFLCEHFDYVESMRDDPKGVVKPLECKPFQWHSYGQFMEWLYGGIEGDAWGWAHCTPYLIFDKTCFLSLNEIGTSEIEKPSLDLSRYFTIKGSVKTESISVLLEMGQYGWAYLHIKLGDRAAKVRISDVFPPFDTMLAWIKMIDRGDIPALFHIDKEGNEKTLSVFTTDDVKRVLFRLTERYTDKVLLEGIVDRYQLLAEFKRALLLFFRESFDPEHWREWESEDEGSCLRVRMLNDRWLLQQKLQT